MASDLGYVQHVCDQVRGAGQLSYRKMFGEYAIYIEGKVVALVCDNQLFVKPTEAGRRLLRTPAEGAPYPGARPHFLLDEHLDDSELLSAVFRETAAALPAPKPKKRTKPAVLLIAALLALPAPAAAQQFQARVADPAFARGMGPRVLWDAGHQNEHHWWMTAFHDVLRMDGFRLDFHGGRWTRPALASADIVVIPGPTAVHRDSLIARGAEHYWWSDEGRQSAFTSDEVSALVDWVHAGGSLLVILDHAPHPDAARMLTEALGVEVRNSMTWDGTRRPLDYADTENQRASKILFDRDHASLGAHPILEGRNEAERIDRVATYVGSSLAGPLGSSPLLLLSPQSFDYLRDPPERGGREHRISAAGRAQAVAFTLGAGRVVVVAEFTPFQARWGGSGDPDGKLGAGMAYAGAQDQQFVLNITRWLARIIS